MYNKCIKFTNTFLDLLIAALRCSKDKVIVKCNR